MKQKLFFLLLLCAALLLCACGRQPKDPLSGQTVEEMLKNNRGESIRIDGQIYDPKQDVQTILLMGIDHDDVNQSSGNLFSGQADALALLVIDRKEETYRLLPIDRNTLCDVNVLSLGGDVVDTRTMELCLAHCYGNGGADSCENTVAAVSGLLLDIPIDSYVALYMDALPLLNDAVGGVTVTIEDDFSQEDPSLVLGQEITLTGRQAYHYLRGRMQVGDGLNEGRMRRQQTYVAAYLTAAREKLRSDKNFAANLYRQLQPYMVANLSGKDINTLAQLMGTYQNGGFATLAGEARIEDNHQQFIVDKESIYATVVELFYEARCR